MDMEFHKGISSSGKLYGFGLLFAECLTAVSDELETARFVESFTRVAELEVAGNSAEEQLTAGVICCVLDEDDMTHIETSEELDSGMYRSIW